MNYEKVFETLINRTKNYLELNNLNSMILGISGGLDSTVTAAICHEVERRNPDIKFYGVSLPCSSNTEEENDSASICMKAFCKAGQYWTENLQKEYLLMKATCSQRHLPTTIGMGNLKARLRMMYLYDMANYTSGIVMDTDNLTEHYLGFFTIHGDVADFNPIGGLWKHEVYELAEYLLHDYYNVSKDPTDSLSYKQMALKGAIGITPTDGNGVNSYGDMGQIAPAFVKDNFIEAYKKVDEIIQTYLKYSGRHSEEYLIALDELRAKYDSKEENEPSTVDGIISRIRRTEYKRKGLPIVIERSEYTDEPKY